MTITGKNRIMIFGPKDDGTYVVEFRTAAGEALAISIPRNERSAISRTDALRAVRAGSAAVSWTLAGFSFRHIATVGAPATRSLS